ncbi:hypothetical protein [Sulfurospirillum deleyianum]|uniref:Uncharacterized protein n=1 Tax=Sulfurospirillum deleyianum (strain ATCC 51133 / DSM 6946 / 5175) TaxID=525898 RepID=D1B1M1_SULD5|nr:hypothetical protein [Sulfurospirillum deleyianum]ACZ11991.1 hypothetical protein Sdel_0962 [Sulfurospirillum deleyianum DSM 6946]
MESKKLHRFFVTMPKNLQEETFEYTIQTYYTLKGNPEYQGLNRASLYFESFLIALERSFNIINNGTSKSHARDLQSIQKQSASREKMIDTKKRRAAKKRDKILGQYCALIYSFRYEKKKEFSWIAAYLRRFHKLTIDKTYLFKLYPFIVEKMKNNLDADQGVSNGL